MRDRVEIKLRAGKEDRRDVARAEPKEPGDVQEMKDAGSQKVTGKVFVKIKIIL